jgi:hypothetical protein
LRRLAIIVSLLASSLLVSAVALGGPPRLEQKRLRPADMALAKRTTLRPADLGRGWTRRQPERSPDELPNCPGVDMDFSMFTITGTARSAFAAGTATAESQVEVFESRSDAARDFRKGTSRPVLRCLGRWLRDEAAKASPGARVISSRLLSRPRLGQQAILYRVVMEVPIDTGRLRVFVDIVGFQRGRTAVALVFGSAYAPVRGALGVARKVLTRAR